MVGAARQRHGDVAGLSFDVAGVAQLPFGEASFDARWIDRVLQHIADPYRAILEMVRSRNHVRARIRARIGAPATIVKGTATGKSESIDRISVRRTMVASARVASSMAK